MMNQQQLLSQLIEGVVSNNATIADEALQLLHDEFKTTPEELILCILENNKTHGRGPFQKGCLLQFIDANIIRGNDYDVDFTYKNIFELLNEVHDFFHPVIWKGIQYNFKKNASPLTIERENHEGIRKTLGMNDWPFVKQQRGRIKHFFGMAKSSMDLRGGKGRNMELDFLRLVYAVKWHIERGSQAHGYLAVLDSKKNAQRIDVWKKKYHAESFVTCLNPPINSEQRAALKKEKDANALAVKAGMQGETASLLSQATEGSKIGEQVLREEIKKAEPSVQEITDKGQMLFDIRWDYYGIVEQE